MDQHLKLPGAIADHPQVGGDTASDETAQQGSLRGNAHVPLSAKRQLFQPGLPARLAGKLPPAATQLSHQRGRQLLPFPVGPGRRVDRVEPVAAWQHL